jgi:hypothetical protein
VKLKLRAHKKIPELVRMLKLLSFEKVEFNVLECMFCKDVLAHLWLRNLCEMEQFFCEYPS